MGKIIVFDFDKTLTNYDTTFPFFLFCCRKNPIRYVFVPLFVFTKLLSKVKFISVKMEKEIGLKLFCPKYYDLIKEYCKEFAKTIVLNDICNVELKNLCFNNDNRIIIASASFQLYLEELFPSLTVIGTTIAFNKRGVIEKIDKHPFKKMKAELIRNFGIKTIDCFYTDSEHDMPTSKMSVVTKWIKNGEIVS